MIGPLGLTFAMLKFGYSKSFLSMVISRCFQGVFNGNIGALKLLNYTLYFIQHHIRGIKNCYGRGTILPKCLTPVVLNLSS